MLLARTRVQMTAAVAVARRDRCQCRAFESGWCSAATPGCGQFNQEDEITAGRCEGEER
jgi:hypothetical protein